MNLIIVKNSCLEVFDVTSEGLKQIRDVPLNANILTASLFRRRDQNVDSLFVLNQLAEIAIIECVRNNESIEFHTITSGSVADHSARMIDQGFDALVDPDATYIMIKLYHGLLKVIPLHSLSDRGSSVDVLEPKVKAHSIRIEEGNIVDMAFLHGYSLPTFALIYEDEVVVFMKTYEIFGREPALRSVPFTVDSIEPNSKLLIPVPAPYGGVILVGDNIICYHTREVPHISQYIPQTKFSQIVCYAQVDAKRYLLGDMAGRLYMVHLLPPDENTIPPTPSSSRDTTQTSARIGSIRIELLGETVIPESIVYLDNGVVFVGSFMGDSQLIRLNPDIDPERNSYITVLEQFTNIGPIVDMVLLESKGQNQLITCSGCYKEGSLRVIRNGIGIQEHATVDQEQIKGVWCFPFESATFDDSLVISMVGQTQLLRLVDDDITALQIEGFKTDEQTVHCDVVSPADFHQRPRSLVLQATTSGLRLIGIQALLGKGCLAEWKPPSDRSVSCLASHVDLVVVASGPNLYALRITGTSETPEFTQISHAILSHEVACVDISPFDKSAAVRAALASASSLPSPSVANSSGDTSNPLPKNSEPEYVAVGLWLGHGIALLKLPSLEVVHTESLPEVIASSGTAVLPRSILIAQLEEAAFLFAAMADGSVYYYTIDCTSGNVFLRDAKRVNAGTGPSMHLSQWRSHNKGHIFVCSNHPCVVYSTRNKLVFSNVNLKEVTWMAPLNGSYYTNCICLVIPSGLVIGSVDNLQKLHVRTIPLGESPRRLALQPETGSLGVITYRREVFQEGVGFKPIRHSVSLSPKLHKSSSPVPKTISSLPTATKFPDVEVSSLLIYNQSNLELQLVHTFHYSQTVLEMGMSIASINLGENGGTVYAVGTALFAKDDIEPKKGRIHLFRYNPEISKLETLLIHDVNGSVFRILDFNGRILAAVTSSVRLFDVCGDSLRLASSYNDNIIVLYLRSKDDYVLIGDLMRSLNLLIYKQNMNNFEAVGRHRYPRYTCGIEILDDEHFLAGDADGNIFVVARDSPENTQEPVIPALRMATPASVTHPESASSTSASAKAGADGDQVSSAPSEMKTLVDCAYMHTGESINTFVRGNLIMQNMEEKWKAVGETHSLYGTAQGYLGLIVHLSPVLFAFLKEVETRVSKLIVPVGGFTHESWRACKEHRKIKMAHNFVDGEVIETFLDLTPDEKARVVNGLRIPVSLEEFGVAGASTFNEHPETRPCKVEDLVKVVEEMAALH
ncbi:unnamed protein product [Mesocestoides corti]|uniref:DNA damage-binding protein 1 n=1 Tax=Mesocestoides corti TaxID=53468 RepID=A0A3P6H9W8_MESCO|nr:unnamed protein product [Mesocestoides corti]